MTPHKQLIKHNPAAGEYGDCQRTCVGVILNLPPEQVPHFCDNPKAERGTDEWWANRQDKWLSERGLAYATVAYDGQCSIGDVMKWTSEQNPNVPMILLGKSSLGSNHVVVILNGEIFCDPSGNGIVGPSTDGTWEVSMITVGKNYWGISS